MQSSFQPVLMTTLWTGATTVGSRGYVSAKPFTSCKPSASRPSAMKAAAHFAFLRATQVVVHNGDFISNWKFDMIHDKLERSRKDDGIDDYIYGLGAAVVAG